MDKTEKARGLGGDALEQFALDLFGTDSDGVGGLIVGLVRSGTPDDLEHIAAIIDRAPLGNAADSYQSARYGKSHAANRLDYFMGLCEANGCGEGEYIRVLIGTGYAEEGSALYGWRTAADVYLERRAAEDFDAVAAYLDAYDRGFRKYGALFRSDAERAARKLLGKILFAKHIDKTAIRAALMDHSELIDYLIKLYGNAKARERAAITRLLLVYRSDVNVKRFLDETVAYDESKTVRDVLLGARKGCRSGKKPTKRVDPVQFFESAMANGDCYAVSEWKEMLKDARFAAVADRLFFCSAKGDTLYLFNNGEFLDMRDKPAELKSGALIRVMHPVDAEGSEIASLRIYQPFPQLSRIVFAPIPGEVFFSKRLSGSIVSRGEFDRSFKRLGFAFSVKRSAGEADLALKRIGDYYIGVECELKDASDTAGCGNLYYYAADDLVKLNKQLFASAAQPKDIRELPRREYSELTLAACALFGRE